MRNAAKSFVFSLISLLSFFSSCISIDTITPTQPIIDDGNTLISTGKIFELGFFSPKNSNKRYVGIWFHKISAKTVVWVANRENPVTDSSGVLTINRYGNLAILDGKGRTLWSCNASVVSQNSTATIFDTGNLVLSEMSEEGNVNKNHLWQSFDDPSDSFLSRMEISVNLRTKEKKVVTSWRSEDDPALGNYMFGLEAEVIPQLFIWNGSIPYWRSGQWNGRTFIGMPYMYDVYINGPTLVEKDGIVYYAHSYSIDEYSRLWLDWKGMFRQEKWDEGRKEWYSTWVQLHTQCDVYGTCGPFGICKETESPVCSCLRGFKPKFPEEWSMGNWSGGCVRRVQLNCERNTSNGAYDGGRDGFLKLGSVKMPDFAGWVRDIDANACEAKCLNNCSCVAYAHVSGIGCMIWSGDLIDLRDLDAAGEDLHIRVANSELGKKKNLKSIIIGTLAVGVFILSCCTCIFFRRIARKGASRNQKKETDISLFDTTLLSSPSSDLTVLRHGAKKSKGGELLFDFDLIALATNNFSPKNKIGEGGFGPVYKGKLPKGQKIAVKRLSKSSGQGLEQFKNEVVLISKLQHRNLVRLLGCCIQGEEKLLVYEYMPNKSLDAFLFDPSQGATLEWKKRFHIVEEIARGILYLHRDSRLRIIHRDLKAGNILLDGQLNPKISDFGMARIFGGDQIIARTDRVVGTYGYMSPEYAMEGRFSEKSDVFSFGVLLLEIVSGKRSTGFHHPEYSLSLLGYVWRLWNDGNISAIIDPILGDLSSTTEVLRCIQVGLLCVQEFANDRPIMSSVVSMLSSDIAALPTPKQPAFAERTPTKTECSKNEVSITIFQGR